MKNLLIFLFGCCITSQAAFALPAVFGDYNGDGLTDFVLAQISTYSELTVFKGSFSTGTTDAVFINARADAFVPGDYFGESVYRPAIIKVTRRSAPLEWHLWRPRGPVEIRYFGLPGDTPVPGDYDCDGKTDFAVRGAEGDNGVWKIQKSSTGEEVEVRFGFKDDRAFGADTNSDGCSEMFAVRLVGGSIFWFSRSLNRDGEGSVQWGIEGDTPLRPIDLDGDGGAEYIVVRSEGNINNAYVAFSNGNTAVIPLGGARTVPLTGRFGGRNALGYWDRVSGYFSVLQPDLSVVSTAFGSSSDILIRADGSVVLPGTYDRMTRSDAGNISCDIRRNPRDGRAGYVHNPNNSRRTIKAVLPPEWTYQVASVKVYANGKLFDTLKFAVGFEYGGRERYYGKYPVKKYPRNLLQVITLKDGRNVCITIPNPRQRYD